MKLCPSWKVYQGWMGCDPFDNIAIPLYEVTVNNVYEIGRAGFHALTSQIGKAAPNGLGAFLNPDFLASAIGTDHRFRSTADLSPFALAGHSLGGYTVLGLAVRGQAGNSLRSRQSGPGLLHRARTANSSNDWGWSS
jgi:hypothetical protein